jgi:hypothetical protein
MNWVRTAFYLLGLRVQLGLVVAFCVAAAAGTSRGSEFERVENRCCSRIEE